MEEKLQLHFNSLLTRHPALLPIAAEIRQGYEMLEACYTRGGKLLVAGNGGSAADAEHIVGELMKRFRLARPVEASFAKKLEAVDPVRGKKLACDLERGLTAIALTGHPSLTTAYMNDVDAGGVFAQQLYAHGRPGDIFLGISTSGNSENILCAAVTAKAAGLTVLGLTGKSGGRLKNLADVTVCAPESETYLIQEMHLPIYHCWCQMLEDHFFGK